LHYFQLLFAFFAQSHYGTDGRTDRHTGMKGNAA